MSANQATSYYDVLGVAEQATLEEIASAYRAGLATIRARMAAGVPLERDILNKLREAYAVVGNADRRAAYDLELAPGKAVSAATGASAAASGNEPLVFEFTGRGGEYFRIWIVNLILSVLTLGIYSAWAKVRREQYFHRNTLLAGSGFDYHGNPRAILKGRLIAWACLLALSIAQRFSLPAYVVLLVCLMALGPWFIMRSLRFRAANTSYRGLRFRHRGTYRQAVAAFLGNGLLLLPTIGIWMPMWVRAIKRFQIGKLSFGGTDFSCEPRPGGFFGAYLMAGLLMLAPVIVIGIIFAMATPGHGRVAQVLLLGAAAYALVLAVMVLFVRPFLQVRVANVTWNATTLGRHRFHSDQAFRSFWPLRASNVVLIALTLGLYWPWARVREAAYRAKHFALEAADLDQFVAEATQDPSAVGEEIADAFDLEFSL